MEWGLGEQGGNHRVGAELRYIPAECEALRALAQVNQDLVQAVGRRCAEQRIATIDLDAAAIGSWKQEAKAAYEGSRGCQPMLALCAEMDLAVAGEFRDGNVGRGRSCWG